MRASTFESTLLDYTQDYQQAKSLGAAMLACHGMIVPAIAPNIALLIPNCPRPSTTYTEPVEFSYAGGLQAHRPGVPKTSHTGQLQFIETDYGQVKGFMELLNSVGGTTDCIVYDGRPGRYTEAYELSDCAITFEPGEFDAEGRSTIMLISAPMSYMYFVINAQLGISYEIGRITESNTVVNQFLARANSILASVQAGNPLYRALASDIAKW
ncbi:hypothetical protein [Acinetobacter soli]|uniref:hypothetical protein n=1 Tax=Acinetobacter soli TaxID=487316 RepID=UPI00300B2278